MNNSLFVDFDQTLEKGTPKEAVDRLCILLKNKGDYHSLFEALLLQARMKWGLPAILSPTGKELTTDQKSQYEEEVKSAAREVGRLFLEEKNLMNAWPYFRMIGEPTAMAQALESWEPAEAEEEIFPSVLEMAIQQGAHPIRGFQLLLKKYGTCNAITTLSQSFPHSGSIRQQCVTLLVEALYQDLRNSLCLHVKELTGDVPHDHTSISEILKSTEGLLQDETYHIDISHLSSVVQFALELPTGDTTKKVQELCEYGCRLSPRFQPQSDTPFDSGYRDYLTYYRTLNLQDVDSGLNHFRMKAESVQEGSEQTSPAEVYVHLLSQLGRHAEALEAFARYLAQANPRQLACPMPTELARKSGRYDALAELCLRRGDAVGYAVAKTAAK
ncbi:MAG TPA: hypothetical protein PKA06_02230 [Gemmatales bacterium]|nr:hypothetical protein [Gemmatales bacterium]HMP15426.1 hypothetical protein [Gemmatales bacterium]